MFLKKIGIINYKSCRDLILDFSDNLPNTFIGKTDSGKSTILNAIGLLLGEKSFPFLAKEGQETSDISTTPVGANRCQDIFKELNIPVFYPDIENSIILIGIFCKQEGDFENDFNDVASNHLKWSIESLGSNEVLLLKQFNDQCPGGCYYICSKDGKDKKEELWKQPQAVLNSFKKPLNITDDDIINDNKAGRFKNIELFKTIYNRLDTCIQWGRYDDFSKKDRKYFPIYRYIDWREITLKSVEEMARDTMSAVIDEYDTKLKESAQILSKEATEKVNLVLEKKIGSIISDLSTITAIKAKVYFESGGKIAEITVEKGTADGSVRLESQGDGVKKQIGFAFMRLGASEGIKEDNKLKRFIWAFDEPEIHLYPPEKREFYETIKQLSEGAFQTFISTHSTVFVDKSKLETIRQVRLADKYTKVSMCSSVSDVHQTLGIKNSDFLFYDIFIAGEGDTEFILIPSFYKLYFGNSIEEDSIQVINLGGDSHWKNNKQLFEQMLKDFKNTDDCVYYLLDGDTKVQENNVFLAGKFDIEDSISNKHWIRLVIDKCGIVLDDSSVEEIRSNLSKDSNKKFHSLLKEKIAKNTARIDFLPSKKECAKLMAEIITDKNDIPVDIVELFKNIKIKP